MFTQRLSMDCTKEQYEKYLKEELLKMGYKEWSINYWGVVDFYYICNNYYGDTGDLGTIHKTALRHYKRTYLGSFNAPLFLALAAMTDNAEGNYGEYVIGLHSDKLFKMEKTDKILPKHYYIRKATKEEIMAKFGENSSNTYTIEDYKDRIDSVIFNLGKLDTQRFADKLIKDSKEQLDAINLLKSKGYKILKPKTWEEV